MKQKLILLKRLKLLYLFIFLVTIILIVPTHLFPAPSLMPLRFPHYLEMMGPFLGVSWPISFEIYHYALFVLVTIASLNVLGILFYPKLSKVALFSSLIGIFLISLIILFFLLVFTKTNLPTSIIYGLYFVVLLIVDILTFKVLIRQTRQKEA